MTRRTVLGKRLGELRKKRGLSQMELGKRTGLTRSHISRIENGHIVPDLDVLESMADLLNVPLSTLFLTDWHFSQLTQKMPEPQSAGSQD